MNASAISGGGFVDIDDLCFTARALAQTHPLTENALRYKQACFDSERERQHVTDLADWATTALLVGYCLRRAEEHVSGLTIEIMARDTDEISSLAGELADTLRDGDADSITLLASVTAIAALDRLIGTEIHKRNEHMREQLGQQAWSELEQYIAWWVIHGYCVRASEAPRP